MVEEEVKHIRVNAATKAKESRVGAIFVVFLSLAIITLWAVRARKHDPRDLSRVTPQAMIGVMSGHAGHAPPAPSGVPELSVSPPTSALRAGEVSQALAPNVPRSAACMRGVYATVFVEVVFAPSGEAKEARYAKSNKLPVGELLQDTCVLTELRAAKIAPGPDEVTATFPVRNMPGRDVVKKAA